MVMREVRKYGALKELKRQQLASKADSSDQHMHDDSDEEMKVERLDPEMVLP